MNVALKPFPACHLAHAFADAAIALRGAGLDPADVDGVTALVPEEIVPIVCEPAAAKRRPANHYDAQFSLPYIVAASLVRGKFGLAELDEAALADPQVLALAAKVRYEIDPGSGFPRHYSGEVVVRTADGRERRHREQVNRGSADRPLADAEIEDKFMQNAAYAVTRQRTYEIQEAVLRLPDNSSARELERALGAA